MKRCVVGLVLGISAWLGASTCQGQESLERGLLKQAPKLIKYFKDQGYKNVGVLKFLVMREGDKKFSDNVGTMNLLAARRLELALILANDPRNPVGIIDNASAVASRIAGASHLKKDARQKLFTSEYPLAWGKDMVRPDAFVTGKAEISKDLRKLTLSLEVFGRATNKLDPWGEDFQVANSTDRLAEMGESFQLRGVFDDGQTDVVKAKNQEKVYEDAIKVHKQQAKHPADPTRQDQQPVTLEVRYDKRPIPLEFRNGKAFIQEPRQGQSVVFGLKRDAGKEKYGVVLKVNGENTLEKERLPDLSCKKWILYPGLGPWQIDGYYVGKTVEFFRVASEAESQQRAFHYGPDVGTITMTVFREQKGKVREGILDDDAQYETVVKKVTELKDRPNNYNALKAQLLADANRELIVGGKIGSSDVEVVHFTADPNPIMSVTIVYYQRR
jgi:hypothetical protein